MKPQSLCLVATAALGLMLAPVPSFAQSTPAATPSSQYEGVSHPPPDDTIEASPEAAPAPAAAPAPTPKVAPAAASAKPLPGIAATPTPAATITNPDDGVVGDAMPAARATAAPDQVTTGTAQRTGLIARPENPDFGVVTLVPSPSNQLADGTNIRVRLMQKLSTRTTQDGSSFRAQVAADVYKEGRVVIPVGSELRGRVVSVTQGHRLGTPATLRLRPEAVLLPDGTSYHLYAQAIRSDAPDTRTDSEGGIQPSSRIAKNLIEYGAATGGGAATGAILGGPAGAAAGAIVGAGVITTHLLLQHPSQAEVAQGSEITFSLTEPMDLVATRN